MHPVFSDALVGLDMVVLYYNDFINVPPKASVCNPFKFVNRKRGNSDINCKRPVRKQVTVVRLIVAFTGGLFTTSYVPRHNLASR